MALQSNCGFRRRTNSFASSGNIVLSQQGSDAIQTFTLEDRGTPSATPTRFRRSSFALSGERQTTLDCLVDSASLQALNAAATREASTISSIVSSTSEVEKSRDVHLCSPSDSVDPTKRLSVVTIVPQSTATQLNSGPSFCSSSLEDIKGSVEKTDFGSPKGIREACSKSPFIWHNADAFPSNPLTSEVVVNYLATLAASVQQSGDRPSRVSPTRPPSLIGENIPGLFPLSAAPVPSMTMPMKQVRSPRLDCAQSSTKTSINYDSPDYFRIHLEKPNVRTDIHHSAGLSDTEAWYNWHRQGYVSDNPSMEVNKLRLFPQHRDADFHLSAALCRSPRKGRPRSRDHRGSDKGILPGTTPSSPRSSRFDVTHVYDGLPSPRVHDAKLSASSTCLNMDFPLSCTTPPSTPNSMSSRSSAGHPSHSLHSLRSLFDHLKPQFTDDDQNDQKYVYLDEETRARRARSQASNMISPVSF